MIISFLTAKWVRESGHGLIKETWGCTDNRIAVRFAYEWYDVSGHWFRSYGNDSWEFDARGLMQKRFASINDLAISDGDRELDWPLLHRPGGHPALSDLGL